MNTIFRKTSSGSLKYRSTARVALLKRCYIFTVLKNTCLSAALIDRHTSFSYKIQTTPIAPLHVKLFEPESKLACFVLAQKKTKKRLALAPLTQSASRYTPFFNFTFDKGRLKNLVTWTLENYGEYKTVELLEQLKKTGFEYATKAGISLGIEDLKIPPKKSLLLLEAEQQTRLTVQQYKRGDITAVERFKRLIDTWHRTSEQLKQEVISYFEETDVLNPVYMMAFSGARGNISQVRQLVGMRGLMSDPKGQIIDYPIRSNFREGLTLTEYIISSYGSRKGIVDTALRTANAGYLTRRLVDVAQHVIISHYDCRTQKGIFVTDMKEGNKSILSLQNRLIGRVLARDVLFQEQRIASKNQEISSNLAAEIARVTHRVFIRSSLTCDTTKLICQLCYGWSLAQGKLVSIGETVGVIAAQSIGEPGTQLTMRTFHTGGVFAGDVSDEIRAPFDGFVEYTHSIPGSLIRTLDGKIAFLTKSDGTLIMVEGNELGSIDSNSNNAPLTEVSMGPTSKLKDANALSAKVKKYKIPAYTILFIRNNQRIFKKQVVAQITNQVNVSDTAEYTIHSELEGSFYSKNLQFQKKLIGPKPKSSDDILSFQGMQIQLQSKDWNFAWVLSGKRYEIPFFAPLFPFLGDYLTTQTIMTQNIWAQTGHQPLFRNLANANGHVKFTHRAISALAIAELRSANLRPYDKSNISAKKGTYDIYNKMSISPEAYGFRVGSKSGDQGSYPEMSAFSINRIIKGNFSTSLIRCAQQRGLLLKLNIKKIKYNYSSYFFISSSKKSECNGVAKANIFSIPVGFSHKLEQQRKTLNYLAEWRSIDKPSSSYYSELSPLHSSDSSLKKSTVSLLFLATSTGALIPINKSPGINPQLGQVKKIFFKSYPKDLYWGRILYQMIKSKENLRIRGKLITSSSSNHQYNLSKITDKSPLMMEMRGTKAILKHICKKHNKCGTTSLKTVAITGKKMRIFAYNLCLKRSLFRLSKLARKWGTNPRFLSNNPVDPNKNVAPFLLVKQNQPKRVVKLIRTGVGITQVKFNAPTISLKSFRLALAKLRSCRPPVMQRSCKGLVVNRQPPNKEYVLSNGCIFNKLFLNKNHYISMLNNCDAQTGPYIKMVCGVSVIKDLAPRELKKTEQSYCQTTFGSARVKIKNLSLSLYCFSLQQSYCGTKRTLAIAPLMQRSSSRTLFGCNGFNTNRRSRNDMRDGGKRQLSPDIILSLLKYKPLSHYNPGSISRTLFSNSPPANFKVWVKNTHGYMPPKITYLGPELTSSLQINPGTNNGVLRDPSIYCRALIFDSLIKSNRFLGIMAQKSSGVSLSETNILSNTGKIIILGYDSPSLPGIVYTKASKLGSTLDNAIGPLTPYYKRFLNKLAADSSRTELKPNSVWFGNSLMSGPQDQKSLYKKFLKEKNKNYRSYVILCNKTFATSLHYRRSAMVTYLNDAINLQSGCALRFKTDSFYRTSSANFRINLLPSASSNTGIIPNKLTYLFFNKQKKTLNLLPKRNTLNVLLEVSKKLKPHLGPSVIKSAETREISPGYGLHQNRNCNQFSNWVSTLDKEQQTVSTYIKINSFKRHLSVKYPTKVKNSGQYTVSLPGISFAAKKQPLYYGAKPLLSRGLNYYSRYITPFYGLTDIVKLKQKQTVSEPTLKIGTDQNYNIFNNKKIQLKKMDRFGDNKSFKVLNKEYYSLAYNKLKCYSQTEPLQRSCITGGRQLQSSALAPFGETNTLKKNLVKTNYLSPFEGEYLKCYAQKSINFKVPFDQVENAGVHYFLKEAPSQVKFARFNVLLTKKDLISLSSKPYFTNSNTINNRLFKLLSIVNQNASFDRRFNSKLNTLKLEDINKQLHYNKLTTLNLPLSIINGAKIRKSNFGVNKWLALKQYPYLTKNQVGSFFVKGAMIKREVVILKAHSRIKTDRRSAIALATSLHQRSYSQTEQSSALAKTITLNSEYIKTLALSYYGSVSPRYLEINPFWYKEKYKTMVQNYVFNGLGVVLNSARFCNKKTNKALDFSPARLGKRPLWYQGIMTHFVGACTSPLTPISFKQNKENLLKVSMNKWLPTDIEGSGRAFISWHKQCEEPLQVIKKAGQLIHMNHQTITLRLGQPLVISPRSIIHAYHGDFVPFKKPVVTLTYEQLKTGDIVQGIPKIEQLFEARTTKRGRLFRDNLTNLLNGLFLKYYAKSSFLLKRSSFYGTHKKPGLSFRNIQSDLSLSEAHKNDKFNEKRSYNIRISQGPNSSRALAGALKWAVKQSFYKIQQIIVDGILRVYRSQGVSISDKHVEIIVKQMTSKVRIISSNSTKIQEYIFSLKSVSGTSKDESSSNSAPLKNEVAQMLIETLIENNQLSPAGLFPGEIVDFDFVENINAFLLFNGQTPKRSDVPAIYQPIKYEPIVLGITRASLEVESFLSAASFQQTTRVLSQAALYKKKDYLKGLKENILIGNLIPAGTGYF